ncbi:hypothetical protein EOC93_08675 [Mesorhizobium sp. M6A.T.Ce.TU.002.03.1.1]|uniref:hypothetical protein n=1 Tax=unclassified Mesorhizobium TaxID=325217 RepID=UPI000FCC7E3D|nr:MULTISPECIES: hypothetical protein [unclassified Mesorhizobium]RUU44996.1 hypothetical protein EOC93_08675 [Mesorhizobium sp. M6A.T.Ce.TU.002.03.1.1]RWQ64514.1 MAG: hypothetical protein EOS86_19810 [Mesorhizobium sp.]
MTTLDMRDAVAEPPRNRREAFQASLLLDYRFLAGSLTRLIARCSWKEVLLVFRSSELSRH